MIDSKDFSLLVVNLKTLELVLIKGNKRAKPLDILAFLS